MPCSRMQHTAALRRSKSCSAYAANAIMTTWKRIFCRPSGLPKLWNEIGELGLTFFFKLADTILKPLIHQMPHGFFWWDRQFVDRIFRPRSIERHADATSTYTCGMAQLCHCVPRGIVWTYLYVSAVTCPILLDCLCGLAHPSFGMFTCSSVSCWDKFRARGSGAPPR